MYVRKQEKTACLNGHLSIRDSSEGLIRKLTAAEEGFTLPYNIITQLDSPYAQVSKKEVIYTM